ISLPDLRCLHRTQSRVNEPFFFLAPRLVEEIEYEFRFVLMNTRLLLYGLVIWTAATIALRVAGQHVLRPGRWTTTLITFLLVFPAMAWIVRRICRKTHLPA